LEVEVFVSKFDGFGAGSTFFDVLNDILVVFDVGMGPV
jgi:hypothetical protein